MTKEEYLKAQEEFQKNNPVGTKVKITRAAKSYESGWDNAWLADMQELIDQVVTIYKYGFYGIDLRTELDVNSYSYPYFILEPIVENKEETQTMKTIIGYKLKEDCKQYEQAALAITGHRSFTLFDRGYMFTLDSVTAEKYKEAGVLDLWFEPVYEKNQFVKGDYIVLSEEGLKYLGDVPDSFEGVMRVDKIHNGHVYPQNRNGIHQLPEYFRKATDAEIQTFFTRELHFGEVCVTISKGVITAEGRKFSIENLKKLRDSMMKVNNTGMSDFVVSFPQVKIGCCTFTIHDIAEIVAVAENQL